jgi:hypothetical protein
MSEPVRLVPKAKYRQDQGAKTIKHTKAGNGKRPSKGLTGSFTHVPPGMGMGDKGKVHK